VEEPTKRRRGRPPLKESELKHPRQQWNRRNVLKSVVKASKPPSKANKALYGPIIDEAIAAVLTQPSRADNVAKKNKIEVTFPKKHKFPEGWPIGRIVKELDGMITRTYNAELVVLWAYEYLYIHWQPTDIYRERMGIMANMSKMEKELEIMLDESFVVEYNEPIEHNEREQNEI